MSRRLIAVWCIGLVACMRWTPQPVVPVQRAFASGATPDVAVRLFADSAHWWRIRQARLVGDSIVGLGKTAGGLHHEAVGLADVELLVIQERDPDIDNTVGILCVFTASLASLWLLGRGHL